MPVMLRLDTMDEDRLMKEVLDKFVNCHEQTYEEFLSTFTYLSKEIAVTKGGRHGTSSSENTFTSVKVSPKNESNGDHHRNTTISVCTASQSSEEDQIAIHAGQEVSSSVQGGRRPAGKVKVNSFLDLEDLDMDEERKPQMSMDALLLPGQVEQDVSTGVPAHVPCVDQPLTSEVKPKPTVERKQKHTEE
uniref:Intraflagellar transport associated protein n=1 Tax=Nannospalax galili TaxID=1026970 RepID=A0A8C6RGU5_NANGA